MSEPGSITHWAHQLRDGTPRQRDEAAAGLYERFWRRLLGLAHRYLDQRVRVREDENDVVQNALNSFFRGAAEDRFPRLDSRNDVWKLLAAITVFKARHAAARHTAAIRDVNREQPAPSNPDDSVLTPEAVQYVEAADASPEDEVAFRESMEHLLHRLEDVRLRQIVVLKFAGHSNEEVAEKLDCCVRTVERKLELIRQLWTRDAEPS